MESISSAQEPPIPREMGPYLLQGILGSGGMGIVYLAVHRETGERVALKTVRVTRTITLASIRREVQSLSRIHHPGIVRIIDHGVWRGLPWYAMELVEGDTLRQRIERYHQRSGPPGAREGTRGLPARPLLEWVRRLCAPLAYMHGCGFVHRDLKPGNVFIRQDGTPALGDFGVAVEFGGAFGREVLQVDSTGLGTLLYMAPEQIRGDLVDARADLYSLGCILYECVTGFAPFRGQTVRELRRAHLQESPTRPSELLQEPLPERLEWLILKLLARRPEDRMGYAEDVARVLSELGLRTDEPAELPRPRPYLYRPPFQGREVVMSRLRELLDGLLSSRGGRVFIGGGSGVGKTRLALEVAREALYRELPVVTCECIPLGLSGTRVDTGMKASPLHPFRSLLAAVADRCKHGGRQETAHLLGPRGKLLVAYEPTLDELPGQRELPPPPPLVDPDAARARIFAALQEVLFSFAEQDSLLLIIDDLQWADEMTLAFLRQLRHEELVERGVLLLGTYRMEEMGDTLREVASAPGSLHLELERLDEHSIESMARGMLALPSLPRAFDRLVRRSEGNPFFVAEYLRATISEGLLHRDEAGQWCLDERARTVGLLEKMSLPGAIAEVIHRRLRELDPRAQVLVEAAAVLGREFDTELLLDTVPLEHPVAMEALQTLRVRQILEKSAGNELRFLHDKLREFTYASIPPQRLRRYHHRAAEAIEHRYRRALDFALYFPGLGNHWAKAGVHDQASRYFLRAGERARVAHANEQAIAFYGAALAEAREHLTRERKEPEDWRPTLRRLHENLGDVLALTGQQEEARAAFDEALTRLGPDERLRRARLHLKRGKTWEMRHQHEEALRAYDEAEATLGPTPSEESPHTTRWWELWMQLHEDRHWIYYWMNRREEMDAQLRKVRPVVETRGTPMQRARLFVLLVNTTLRQRRYVVGPDTLEYGSLAVEAADASGDISTRVLTRFTNAFALLFHGDFEEAERQDLAALEMAEQLGDLTLQSRILTYLTLLYRELGQVERTREYGQRNLEVVLASGMPDYVGASRANLAWMAWKEGRLDEARQTARAALKCWNELSAVYPYPIQWQGLWVLLAVEFQRQDVAEAVKHARALLDPTQQRLPEPLTAGLEAAIAAWDQGQREASREHLEHAVQSAQRLRFL